MGLSSFHFFLVRSVTLFYKGDVSAGQGHCMISVRIKSA